MVVDVVLERDLAEGPVLWLSIAAGARRHLMRVRVTEQDVTVETDLTIPPWLRRFDPTDLIAALARRVLWAAAHDARSARTEANHLLALVANADQSFPNMSTHLTPS